MYPCTGNPRPPCSTSHVAVPCTTFRAILNKSVYFVSDLDTRHCTLYRRRNYSCTSGKPPHQPIHIPLHGLSFLIENHDKPYMLALHVLILHLQHHILICLAACI